MLVKGPQYVLSLLMRGILQSPSAEERRVASLGLLLAWRGEPMADGHLERPQLNAQDKARPKG